MHTARRWVLLVAALVLFSCGFFWPIETTIVPTWKVSVVDSAGNPLPNVNVVQHWKHYSLEGEAHHEEEKRTGPDGCVTFPHRSIEASLAHRVAGPLWEMGKYGVHAGFGPQSWLIAANPEYEGDLKYSGNGPLPNKLVMMPRR
jgi:hypothetical protein